MHPVRKQRLFLVLFIVVVASIATALLLYAVKESANLFYPPADVVAGKAPADKRIRVGGIVREGSVQRATDSLKVRFVVTDFTGDVAVEYEGILPDLFNENDGVVAAGRLNQQGVFIADEVLAKHDENYMPPEVSDALKNAPASAYGNSSSTYSRLPSTYSSSSAKKNTEQ